MKHIKEFKTAYISYSTYHGHTTVRVMDFVSTRGYQRVENLIIKERESNIELTFDTGKWGYNNIKFDWDTQEVIGTIKPNLVQSQYITKDCKVRDEEKVWFGLKKEKPAIYKDLVNEGYVEYLKPKIENETLIFSDFSLHIEEKEKQ